MSETDEVLQCNTQGGLINQSEDTFRQAKHRCVSSCSTVITVIFYFLIIH